MLYLVPTPVGNLGDMTFRSIEILKSVELILAEDTRTSKKLLDHYGIETPTRSYHTHNEHKILASIIELLKGGSDLALITDAGTPSISDPGFLLVRECHKNGIMVSCLPGATALIPALAVSGIPCDRFHFEGFLPHKKGRQTRLEYLSNLNETVVIYESPYRIIKVLKEVSNHFGPDTYISVIKEISKIHETVISDEVREVIKLFEDTSSRIKGEFVVIISK